MCGRVERTSMQVEAGLGCFERRSDVTLVCLGAVVLVHACRSMQGRERKKGK
jgi:hypothetical protein